jgi:hypothetical protein
VGDSGMESKVKEQGAVNSFIVISGFFSSMISSTTLSDDVRMETMLKVLYSVP